MPTLDTPGLRIVPDDLSGEAMQTLIGEHLAGMLGHSPPGHVNALALEGLRAADVSVWSAWRGDALCGCGALKELDRETGEIKSMRTRDAYLGQGVGQAVLNEILRAAGERGYRRLYLETGTGAPFVAAHALYLRNGFAWCGAFGSYTATAFNVFMVRPMTAANSG